VFEMDCGTTSQRPLNNNSSLWLMQLKQNKLVLIRNPLNHSKETGLRARRLPEHPNDMSNSKGKL